MISLLVLVAAPVPLAIHSLLAILAILIVLTLQLSPVLPADR